MAKEKKEEKELRPKPKTASWLLPITLLVALSLIQFLQPDTERASYSDFLKWIESGEIENVQIGQDEIRGTRSLGEKKQPFSVFAVQHPELVEILKQKGISFRGIRTSNWASLLGWILPLLFFVFFWLFIARGLRAGMQGGMFSLGKSKAKVYVEKGVKVRFSDVAGIEEAIEELNEVVQFLKEPERYSSLGGRTPKGVLLVGPPGTGKTLLARAVAGESGVPFFSINGSEFVEMFVGLGAARVRDLFEQARKSAPCIIFIDELDALGKSRAISPIAGGSNEEKEQTLNQLLAEVDGFDPSVGVILLAATNRPEVLDPALLRSGRFDRQVLIDNPDRAGRVAILKIHLKKVKADSQVDPDSIAALTPGFSGADLANLVNEAALIATRRNSKSVEKGDFTSAIERIVAGLERKRRIMNPAERKRVAYHEMGHATVSLALKALDRVHKISIIPRGIGALGYTLQRPIEDRYLMSQGELMNKMAVLLGGRAAENLFLDEPSTGAGDDLAKASNIARAMVIQYGMSERLGLVTYDESGHPFLQQGMNKSFLSSMGPETASIVDEEMRKLLEHAHFVATQVLKMNEKLVTEGSSVLLEKETLEEEEIRTLWEKYGEKVPEKTTSLGFAGLIHPKEP